MPDTTKPLLSPIPEGTRWPSGSCVDLAMLSLSIEEISDRIGMPLLHGIEDGLGRWSAVGGRLPSGADIEIICYSHIPNSVVMRVDKRANYAAVLDEALAQFKLSRKDLKNVSPLVVRRSTWSSMSLPGKFVVVTAMVWFVISTGYFAHRNSIILELLAYSVMLCFLAAAVTSIVCIFIEWPRRRWLSLLPFVACVLSVVISSELVKVIRHAIFVWSLPSYEAVVRQMESGSIPVSTNGDEVPQALPLAHLAYSVVAQKDTNGVLTVEFLTEGEFPLRHYGYLYVSSGIIQPGWTDPHRLISPAERPKWFYISD